MTTLPMKLTLGAVLAMSALPSQLHAEGNRLLPFWGQPYPYGYARVEREYPARLPPCSRRDHRRGELRRPADDPRCEVVLHARD